MTRDFFMGAYPYIIIGIVIAVVAVVYSKTKHGKRASENGEKKQPQSLREWFKSNGMFSVSLSMYAVGFMMWIDNSDSSNPFTWFCLGSTFLCLGAAELHKKKNNEKV